MIHSHVALINPKASISSLNNMLRVHEKKWTFRAKQGKWVNTCASYVSCESTAGWEGAWYAIYSLHVSKLKVNVSLKYARMLFMYVIIISKVNVRACTISERSTFELSFYLTKGMQMRWFLWLYWQVLVTFNCICFIISSR